MEGFEPLYKGALLGLVFIMSFGPIFFALIETSLEKGFLSAAFIALGTVISDASFIMISYFGLSQFLGNELFEYWLGVGGGILLIFLSGYYFFKKPVVIEFDETPGESPLEEINVPEKRMAKPIPVKFSKMTYFAYGIKGFLVNTLNPFLLVFWLGAVGIVTADQDYTISDRFLFFAGSLGSIFLSDLMKAFIASRIQHFLNYNRMVWMNRIAGGVMLYFGIRMLMKTLGVDI